MPFATLLSITVDDQEVLLPYSARNLTAQLEYIQQSESFERSWNGAYIDMSMPQFRKFQMLISCTDFESNGLAQYPPGTDCIVTCLPNLGVNGDGDDSDNRLVINMKMGRWTESREEYAARTSWSLPLYEA